MDFKNIHLGKLIEKKVIENQIDASRIEAFFKVSRKEIEAMYEEKDLSSEIILKWCKLLKYDFFRLYSQHLILFSPPDSADYNIQSNGKTSFLPTFRKNVYTKEIIDFILESLKTKEKTKSQIIEEYKIPKTTLYKWIEKYTK